MGTQLPPKGHSSPHFSANVYCGQTAGCIRMPLGKEVGLGPGDIVLDGDPAPHSRKGEQQPALLFGRCLLLPNRFMHQDTSWYRGRPRPRRHCVRWGPSFPTERGTAAPTFGACLLWSNGRSSQQLLSSCAACDYVGIVYSGAILGPAVAYICGGFLLQLYTHFDTIDTSTSVQLCLFFCTKKQLSSTKH